MTTTAAAVIIIVVTVTSAAATIIIVVVAITASAATIVIIIVKAVVAITPGAAPVKSSIARIMAVYELIRFLVLPTTTPATLRIDKGRQPCGQD